MKLSLFQKGLFVVAFVLAIQLAFLAFYGWLLKEAEFLAEQEFHNKGVIGRSNWISTLLFANNLAGFVHLVESDRESLVYYQRAKQAIPVELAGLAEILKESPDQQERLKQVNLLFGQMFSVFENAEKNSLPVTDKKALHQITHASLLPIWTRLADLRHDLLATDFAQYKINVESLPKARQQRDHSVIILVLIDVLAAAGLLYFYIHGLTARLAILSDNARRFALKQRLNKPVSGNDEITDLDRAFHSMSESLDHAQLRKQEFLSMISHDMRTPLSNVQASLEFVLEGHQQPLSEQTHEWLTRANQNVETVLSLINELLEIERIEGSGLTLVISEVGLSDVIRKSVDSVRAVALQNSITIVEPKLGAYIKCDEDRLIRVLVNLLGNAIKFSPPDSTVTIACKKTTQWFEISVEDQGRGIPSELLSTVFERYKQVTPDDARKLGGSGLGLAISKAIVEAHSGMIEVSSEPGKGSKFSILLPIGSVDLSD